MAAHPFPFRRLGRDAVFTALFCVGCAVLICLVVGSFSQWYPNLVLSLCIGCIALLIIDTVRLYFWGEDARTPVPALLALVAVAVPFAHFAGNRLASLILGFDTRGASQSGSGPSDKMMLFTLLVTSVAVMFFMNRDRVTRAERATAQEKARSEAIARQALQSQLQLLQAQIEPHMLFNTLANLQGLIALDPNRAQEMLDQLIQYLRATLSSSRAETTTLGQEFALMQAYLGLMSVRMGDRLGFTLDLPDRLRKASIAPMMLQPLVENAIIHGLEPKVDGGHITVAASEHEGQLRVSVADTGLGLDAPSAKSGTHLGVSNTRERLLALYGERATITLKPNEPQGAVACITFPLDRS
ncbi:MAG: histidine kinase [Pseudomonadota bacterium]